MQGDGIRLRKLFNGHHDVHLIGTRRKFKLSSNPSAEESRFWLSLMTGDEVDRGGDQAGFARMREASSDTRLTTSPRPSRISSAELHQGVWASGWSPEIAVLSIFENYPAEDDRRRSWMAADGGSGATSSSQADRQLSFSKGSSGHIRPYLDADQTPRDESRQVRANLPTPELPGRLLDTAFRSPGTWPRCSGSATRWPKPDPDHP